MITLESYVCDRWQAGTGSSRTLYNPATEAAMAECGSGGVDFAAVARHAREVGGPALLELGFGGRAALLKAISKALYAKRDELIDLSTSNGGNTRGDAKFDIDGATGTLSAYASFGKGLGDGNQIPDNSIVMGSPGKIVRETTEADLAYIQETVDFYVDNQDRFKNALTRDE